MYKHLYRYTDELLQPGPICNSEKDRGEKKIYIYIYMRITRMRMINSEKGSNVKRYGLRKAQEHEPLVEKCASVMFAGRRS